MEAVLTPGRSRKRDKVRSAWISFAGRIVAQLIGAIATVTLGVVVLGKGHAPAQAADLAMAAQPSVLIATPVRTNGETVIVMLPVGKNGKIDHAMAASIAETFEKTKATARRADAQPQTPIDLPALRSAGPLADTRETPGSPRE
jgi:hypothetical protein